MIHDSDLVSDETRLGRPGRPPPHSASQDWPLLVGLRKPTIIFRSMTPVLMPSNVGFSLDFLPAGPPLPAAIGDDGP
jgi:hypothetical protein